MELILGYKFTNQNYWFEDDFMFILDERDNFYFIQFSPYFHIILIPTDESLCYWTELGKEYWYNKKSIGTYLNFAEIGIKKFQRNGPYKVIKGDFTNDFCMLLEMANDISSEPQPSFSTLKTEEIENKVFSGLFLDVEYNSNSNIVLGNISRFDSLEFGIEYDVFNYKNAVLVFYYYNNKEYKDYDNYDYDDYEVAELTLRRHTVVVGNVASYCSTSVDNKNIPSLNNYFEELTIECFDPIKKSGPFKLSFTGLDVDLLYHLSSLNFLPKTSEILEIYSEEIKRKEHILEQTKLNERKIGYKLKQNFGFLFFGIKIIFIILLIIIGLNFAIEIISIILFGSFRR